MSKNQTDALREVISYILETAHDANIGRGYGKAGGYKSTKQTLGGLRTMGSSIYPYMEDPVELDDENKSNIDDDTISAIASKTNSFRPNFDPNNRRKDNRSLGGNPLGEARWGGQMVSQLPQQSLGMVTPISRALNSPKGNKGTAYSGQKTNTGTPRKTGSTRDFSAGTSDLNADTTDEPVYDFSDILGHKDSGRGNIDKIKKLTWILQNR
jgi:hypothetical protein